MKLPLKTVGLTGGIASGKTVAANALRCAGFRVIDADEISRELTAAGTALSQKIMSAFPIAVHDGTLDRRALRSVIAGDAAARAKLNAITHPAIVEAVKSQVCGSPAVISAPLLFETALSSLCDAVVCVTCPVRLRVERIMKRDGVSKCDAEAIIAAQIHDSVRATLSEFCIPSDVPQSEFERETVELVGALLGAV